MLAKKILGREKNALLLKALVAVSLGCMVLLCGRPAFAGSALDKMETQLALDDLESGTAMNNRGEYKKALTRLSRAIKSERLSKENLAIAYNNRANALDELGRPKEALADYDRAVGLDPGFLQAYYNRGISRYRAGLYKKSSQDFSKVIALDPGYTSAYFNRSFPRAALGLYKKAIKDVEKALSLDPGNLKYKEQLADWKKDAKKKAK